MRTLLWILVWVLLVAGSGWYLWRRLRGLLRSARRLGAELADAEKLLGQVQGQARAGRVPVSPEPAALAAFTGIAQAVKDRRAVRFALSQEKRARRDARRPGWARRVDSDPT